MDFWLEHHHHHQPTQMLTATTERDQITSTALTSSTENIPTLAIQAASELDDVIQGRAKNSPASKKLGELLLATIPKKNGKSSVSLTSGAVAVFCQALEEMPSQQPINTMSDLVSLATQISRDLSTSKNESELVALKQFCIGLARAASTYRPAIESYDPQFVRR